MYKISLSKNEFKFIFVVISAISLESWQVQAMEADSKYLETLGLSKSKVREANKQWLRKSAKKLAKREYTISCREAANGDYFEAFLWMERAALKGNINAQYKLGIMHLNYCVGLEGLLGALDWLKEAKNNGHPKAQIKLGELQYYIEMSYFSENDYRYAIP